MKRIVCCVLLVIFAFSFSAFAMTGSGKVHFGNTTLVAGKQLPQGDYKVTWSGDGKDVQVTLTSEDKRTAVTAPAKIVEGPKAQTTQVVREDNGKLIEIRFGGKTQGLAF
jgi:hypothetical protein